MRPDRPTPGDWMAVPRLSPTIGPPPSRLGTSTSSVQRAADDIMITRRHFTFAGELGHRVSSDPAASGTVHALATSVRPPAHVQRSAGGGAPLREPLPRPAVAEAPVVQRRLEPLPVEDVAAPPVSDAAPPEPAPSRVLRAPAASLARDVGHDNPPPLEVVGAGTPSSPSPLAPASVEPDVVAERAPDVVVERPASMPLPDVWTEPTPPSDAVADAPPVEDQPLAAPSAPARAESPSPPSSPSSRDLAPPIQPRAVQRRAEEAAKSEDVKPLAGLEPTGPELPPLPSWARRPVEGAPAEAATEVATEAMPLPERATPTPAASAHAPVQRHASDEATATDEPTAAMSSEPQEAEAEADEAYDEPPAPIAVEREPLTVSRLADDDAPGDEPAPPAEDLPLHAPASVPAPERIAPLLGDRPAGFVSDGGRIPAVDGHKTGGVAPMPLAPEPARGPLLSATPLTARTPSAIGGGAPVQRTAAGAASTAPVEALPVVAGLARAAGEARPVRASHQTPTANASVQTMPARSLPSLPGERPAASPGPGGNAPLAMPVPGPAPAAGAPRSEPPAAPVAVQTLAATAPSASTSAPARPAMPLQASPPQTQQPSAASATATTIGEAAIAAGIAHRAGDGSVVFTRQEASPDATATEVPIQRSATGSTSSATNATSGQREITVSRVESPTTNAPAPPKPSDAELDVLADKLFPRIRRMIGNDIRTTRGRLGDTPWNKH